MQSLLSRTLQRMWPVECQPFRERRGIKGEGCPLHHLTDLSNLALDYLVCFSFSPQLHLHPQEGHIRLGFGLYI